MEYSQLPNGDLARTRLEWVFMPDNFQVRVLNADGVPSKQSVSTELMYPAFFEVKTSDHEHPLSNYAFILEIERRDELVECLELRIIRPKDSPAITSSTLREVPVTDMLAACRTAGNIARRTNFGEPWGNWQSISLVGPADMLRGKSPDEIRKIKGYKHFPPLTGNEHDGFHLDEDQAKDYVATLRGFGPSSEEVQGAIYWLYHFAEAHDLAPVMFIQRTLGLPSATTSHWVKLARESGTLPPSTRRPRTRKN
ncbi:TPA: hypothetical protein JAJ60_002164 [Corynebacterium striatum]|uniref:SKP1 family protein n=1 Tax=Corynebacterium striatum TaxID=43770 RepID=UPI001419C7ED|nr:SKP1 family protein [Corynebacterium striatum]NHY11009.1 hypothetical protein [Corynebacterium striatum]NHY35417.1 hypothetical protein [Corynebacterium striatum]HAT1132010.1 hypothetical protein [Corynebacterium striatum]HAT1139962.1 hypothetical protein [Corynebacterium striatum]HAT1142307.1 hypothetical protein [Corynebacterium striatum]